MIPIKAKLQLYKNLANKLIANKSQFKNFDYYIEYCKEMFKIYVLQEVCLKGVFLHFCEVAFGEKY